MLKNFTKWIKKQWLSVYLEIKLPANELTCCVSDPNLAAYLKISIYKEILVDDILIGLHTNRFIIIICEYKNHQKLWWITQGLWPGLNPVCRPRECGIIVQGQAEQQDNLGAHMSSCLYSTVLLYMSCVLCLLYVVFVCLISPL